MAKALGAKFLDKNNKEVGQRGICLQDIISIDMTDLDPRLKSVDVEVICDVTNPITGSQSATYTYGPQKGVDKDTMEILENGMINYHKLLKNIFKYHLMIFQDQVQQVDLVEL